MPPPNAATASRLAAAIRAITRIISSNENPGEGRRTHFLTTGSSTVRALRVRRGYS
jgi:hypothetical protein